MNTLRGGELVKKTMLEKYGEDYYSKIGKKGGATKTVTPKGFAALSPEKRREISVKGGKARKK